MRLIITHGVVRRGGRTVLEGGSFSFPAPAAVAVVGLNGSGKSSLFLHLAGMLRAGGVADVRHVAAEEAAPAGAWGQAGVPASVAIAPQHAAFPEWLRVERVARLYGASFPEMVEAMSGLHLQELAGASARALSTGQAQALAAALALARRADLTLLDEPFAALDFRRRIGLLQLLRQRLREGGSLLVSSQSAADFEDLCQDFLVIRDGRYVFSGVRSELLESGVTVEARLLELLT